MRPELDSKTNPEEFLNYYYLKEELFKFCKQNAIPPNGSKKELSNRIYEYLKSGRIVMPKKTASNKVSSYEEILTLNSKISDEYKNDERHRTFFKSIIGNQFKFNVLFMNWMKENTGKTYKEAVLEWKRIKEEKKFGKKTEISSQFEYNQYTRDFFKANTNRSREDAIKCWKYKKSLPGHNKYEESDLGVLNQ